MIEQTDCTRKKIALAVIAFVLCIIVSFNTSSADHHNYVAWYQLAGRGRYLSIYQPGFGFSMLLAHRFGLEIEGFLLIYSGVALYLMAKSFYDYCKYPVVAMFLYCIYPFLMDGEQIRNFMAEAVIFYAVRYLHTYTRKNMACYILLVLVACSFHITAIVTLTYMLVYLDDYKKILWLSLVIAFSLLSLVALFPGLFMRLAILVAGREHFMTYTNSRGSLRKVLGYGAFAIMINVIACLYCQYGKTHDKKMFLIKLFPLTIVMASGILFIDQMYRFFRNMTPFMYVGLINMGIHVEKNKIQFKAINLASSVVAVMVSVFFFIYHLWKGTSGYENILLPLLQENSFFNSLFL